MKFFFLLAFAFGAAFATQTVAILPSDGTLNDDENELLTDKMREAALKVLPLNQFTLLKQDVVIKRLGGMDSYIKECSATSCIVNLGKKAQVDYVAQCRVGKLGNELRITVELYEVSSGGLLGMFSDIAENFYKLPPLMDKNIPDVFKNITTYKRESPVAIVPTPVSPAEPPPQDDKEDKIRALWGSGETSDLENAVMMSELGQKEPEKKIDPQVDKSDAGLSWRGWTRIAAFTAAAVFGGISYLKYSEAKDAKDRMNELKNASMDSWDREIFVREYDSNKDLSNKSMLQSKICGGFAIGSAAVGIVTFIRF